MRNRKFICYLLDQEKNLIASSRPRRFGKTIAVRMLTAYYSRGCDSRKLFAGLAITKDDSFQEHLNKYNEEFKEYIDKQGLIDVWCAVQTEDFTTYEDGSEGASSCFQGNNTGFICSPATFSVNYWDNEKYPELLPGCEEENFDADAGADQGCSGKSPSCSGCSVKISKKQVSLNFTIVSQNLSFL